MPTMRLWNEFIGKMADVIELAESKDDILADIVEEEEAIGKHGTATITAAATEISVAHGWSTTPDLAQISVTPTNFMGLATKFKIGNVGSANFKIIIDAVPGGTDTAEFAWQILNTELKS